jgi:hypothetical protein
MALITAATEANMHIVGFTDGMVPLPRADRHRRQVGGGRHGLKRVQHRRPGRRRHAGRRWI